MIGVSVITIDGESVHTRNVSRSLFAGPVTLESLDPTPKNPTIANFFTQMGRLEELGSGTRSLYKFSRLYTGGDPFWRTAISSPRSYRCRLSWR